MFTIDHNNDSDLSGDESDFSDAEDMDFRPDSAMDRYRSQQAQISPNSQSPSALTSFRDMQEDRAGGTVETSYMAGDHRHAQPRAAKTPYNANPQKLKEYEKSLDEDDHLLKEYERLQELEKQQEKLREGDPSPREQGRLRELRVPSAGPRAASPRRGASPKPAPFPMSVMDRPYSPGQEMYRDRPRKIK